MKNLFYLLIILVGFSSCEELCNCDNNTVDNGNVLSCNEIFPGFWKTTSNCANTVSQPYTITINESLDCLGTTFYNFLGDGEIITIEFGTQSLIIPRQEFDKSDDIFGTGFLQNDTLRITFTLQDRTFGWEDLCEIIAVPE